MRGSVPGGRRSTRAFGVFVNPVEVYGIARSYADDVALARLGTDHRPACCRPAAHTTRVASLAVHVGAGLCDLRRLQMVDLAADASRGTSLVASCRIL